jgi:hypothetical protein
MTYFCKAKRLFIARDLSKNAKANEGFLSNQLPGQVQGALANDPA